MSEHKVTVTVELNDGTIIQKVERFSGGNPRFHAQEFDAKATLASNYVELAIAGMYGDARGRDEN